MPALAVYNFGNAVFSAVGDTRRPLYYLSIAGVINVVLNLFFVIVCNMDVAGVAVASIISQYFSAILVTAALLRSRESYCLRFSQLRFHKTRTESYSIHRYPVRTAKRHFRVGQSVHPAGRQHLQRHHGGGKLRRYQRRRAGV